MGDPSQPGPRVVEGRDLLGLPGEAREQQVQAQARHRNEDQQAPGEGCQTAHGLDDGSSKTGCPERAQRVIADR